MAACCSCCKAVRPKYKRLVDNIFPELQQDGLVKNNMAKLTFYAMTSPEKLDRIGAYMSQRLTRDLHRRKIGYVFITMEALDQLLLACHSPSLNLFVESFLKMVQTLLERDEADLQEVATSSFIKFANIEEATPSYHRTYDFFVSRFSSMCHSGVDNLDDRRRIRVSGLRGLQGVVRKTVGDDLQVNIWDPIHMDKIVISLLYNIQDPSYVGTVDLTESPRDEDHPEYVAETVFRDLVCRASYGNIKSVVKPVLTHMDNHELWVPVHFAVKIFKIIMYSVQSQHAYLVIQALMSHLDTHAKSEASVKASIVNVLFETVLISAGGSIGPSVLELFNTLLRHLRLSVDMKSPNSQSERKYQENIINTIGEFANNLPDYQKIEILMFVMGKFPQTTITQGDDGDAMDAQIQLMLLKTVLKIATKYKTVTMSSAFPSDFLDPLLSLSVSDNDMMMRLIIQEILHTMIDRHDNAHKLKTIRIPKDISELDLTVEPSPRHDIMFMKKNGLQFYIHIYENMDLKTNRVENFEALYCTMCLICIEMGGDEILVELLRLALDIQNLACTSTDIVMSHKCAIHALLAAYLNLISHLTGIPALQQHVAEVVECRVQSAPHLLPSFAFNKTTSPRHSFTLDSNIPESCLFNQTIITEGLGNSGHDTTRLATSFTDTQFHVGEVGQEHSVSDINSITLEMDSVDHSPALSRRSTEEITYESLKKMLNSDGAEDREEKNRKRLEIIERFQTQPFEDIVAISEAKSSVFHNKLNEILDMLSQPSDTDMNSKNNSHTTISLTDMHFPEMFVN